MRHQRTNKELLLIIILFTFGGIISIFSLLHFIGLGREYGYFELILDLIIPIFDFRYLHFGITLIICAVYIMRRSKKDIKQEQAGAGAHLTVKQDSNPISVLEWFATFILLSIPLVNLIFLFVWAFGSEVSKRNFSRATLLYILVSSVVALLIAIVTLSN